MRILFVIAIVLTMSVLTAQARAQSSIQKMAAVFAGNFSEVEIRQRLDIAITKYGRPHSESEYGHVGSVLVKMRQMTNVREMDILSCTIYASSESASVDLIDMIANCAAALERQ